MPVGVYGKYPAKRDFIVASMPRALMELIEKWLQVGLASSRHALGPAFADHYMIQPLWCFRIGSGIAGMDSAGVLMPSVDGVGRSFPLVIVSHAADGETRLADPDPQAWYPEASARLLSALDDATMPPEPQGLIDGLDDHPVMEPGMPKEMPSGGFAAIVGDGALNDAIATARHMHALAQSRHGSLWWTAGGDLVAAQAVAFSGMPKPEFMTAMLGGKPAP
ncbi:MAG: type VI secretion system-associated protein TagF [Rhizobiaceae bacterium]|jgi:type VI secretion system protein ImpM|nr:type VI secretion system-associated protein TagF [Rhizobiaceae bacterium]